MCMFILSINNFISLNKTRACAFSTSSRIIKIRLIPANSIMKTHTIICILDTQKHILNHKTIRKLMPFLILMLFRIKEAKNITPIYSENQFHKCTIGTTQEARQRYKQALIPNIKHNKKKGLND